MAGLCRLDEQLRCFNLPPPEEVASLRVVVCTCCAAGLLTHGEYGAWRTAARQRLMFTHVMIDEAGQVSGLSAECAGTCSWMSCCKMHGFSHKPAKRCRAARRVLPLRCLHGARRMSMPPVTGSSAGGADPLDPAGPNGWTSTALWRSQVGCRQGPVARPCCTRELWHLRHPIELLPMPACGPGYPLVAPVIMVFPSRMSTQFGAVHLGCLWRRRGVPLAWHI